MHFNSKKTSLVILALTALAYSRAMFSFFNDPEGPNVLVVTVMAAIIYVLSLVAYRYYPSKKQGDLKKLFVLIVLQVLIVTGFYFCLR